MSIYYTKTGPFTALTTARAETINSELDLISAGFDSVESAINALTADLAAVEVGTPPGDFGDAVEMWRYLVGGGTANAITATPSPAPGGTDALQAGMRWLIKVAATNTGAVTLDVGTTDGTVDVKKLIPGSGKEALVANDLLINEPYWFIFDGTDFIVQLTQSGVTNDMRDASAADVTVTLPAPANYNLYIVRSYTDPGSNNVIINNSVATEMARLGRKNQYAVFYSDGTTDYHIGTYPSNEIILQYALASDGAALTVSATNKLTLDELVTDDGPDVVSLSSSVFVLEAGTYMLKEGWAIMNTTTSGTSAVLQLVNTTDSAGITKGVVEEPVSNRVRRMELPPTQFTIAASKNIELQLKLGSTGVHTNGVYYDPPATGEECIYNYLRFERLY